MLSYRCVSSVLQSEFIFVIKTTFQMEFWWRQEEREQIEIRKK